MTCEAATSAVELALLLVKAFAVGVVGVLVLRVIVLACMAGQSVINRGAE